MTGLCLAGPWIDDIHPQIRAESRLSTTSVFVDGPEIHLKDFSPELRLLAIRKGSFHGLGDRHLPRLSSLFGGRV
jgi:hypothetical protein